MPETDITIYIKYTQNVVNDVMLVAYIFYILLIILFQNLTTTTHTQFCLLPFTIYKK